LSIANNFKKMEEGFDFGQAVAEADRCLLCYDAPCSRGCPGGTEPAAFIRKLRMRNITGAVRTIKTNNILGGACGVLCPSASLCEKECSATGIDRPIRIGKIQRFLIEHSWETGFKVFEKPEHKKEKVAVMGSGPAGLSCAAELAKDGYQVTIFEARPEPGGVLRYGVPFYRFSTEFLKKEIRDVTDLGVEIKCSTPVRGEKAVEKLLEQGFAAIFLAPGLWQPLRLKNNMETMNGLFTSTGFLAALKEEKYDQVKKFITGKNVAVIGGGSVAIDCAESSLRLGAKDVYLVYRRSYTQMPAEDDERISALQQGVHFLLLNQPLDYVKDAKGNLKGIKIRRTRLGETDASGRRKPVEIAGSDWNLEVEACIEAIGAEPEDESPGWYPSVGVTDKKLIIVDKETGATSVKAIFAGGDIIRGPGLVIQAVQDGKIAAGAIKEYIKQKRGSDG
jgi:glutamate synthase (NADPH/NADH) small chain